MTLLYAHADRFAEQRNRSHVNINDILIVGDSWSSAVVAGDPSHRGWSALLGIPMERNLAVAGSTAVEWAGNYRHYAMNAAAVAADTLILSLGGNDAFQAHSDGVITVTEIFEAVTALRRVLTGLRRKRMLVLLYADPYCGANPGAVKGLTYLNMGIELSCAGLHEVELVDLREVLNKEHFDGYDIHPNLAGHEVIAAGIKRRLA